MSLLWLDRYYCKQENIWNHLHALEVNLHMLAADKCETCVHASQTCVHATLPLLF
jgi:hypothetical protein